MALAVELDADLLDELKLRLEEIDVVLLVRRQLLEDVLGDAVVCRVAMARCFEIERTGGSFGGEITFDDLWNSLTNFQEIEFL